MDKRTKRVLVQLIIIIESLVIMAKVQPAAEQMLRDQLVVAKNILDEVL